MKNMIKDYIKYVENSLNNKKTDYLNLEKDLLIKIQFFQHERLIHFLVTMLVSIITVILLVTSLFINNLLLLIILLIFVLLLIPYMLHYYFLENSVQYLYKLYNQVVEKNKK